MRLKWYKSLEWADGLDTFDEWYRRALDFVNADGDDHDVNSTCWHKPAETGPGSQQSPWIRVNRPLRPLFGELTRDVIDFCYDVANLDPTVIWDVYCHIDCYMHLRKGRDAPLHKVPISQIEAELRRAQMLWERSHRAGTTDVKPSVNSRLVKPTRRYKTPKCPDCKGQTRVTRTIGKKRYLECERCAWTGNSEDIVNTFVDNS